MTLYPIKVWNHSEQQNASELLSSVAKEQKRLVEAPIAHSIDYPEGEIDVLNSNRKSQFTFEELVSIVHDILL